MFARLIQKELLHHLLDLRFVGVFILCILLSGLSVYVGARNYARRLQEYNAVHESNQRAFQENVLNKGRVVDLVWGGYRWNRRPEVLSPMVHGLSGTLGREALIQYRLPPLFQASLFATDPVHAFFGVLDLAFIVKMVLSLCVLLFTFDAVCGEKEGGTLRLYASFPVPRSTMALTKLVSSTVAVLVPFIFAFLLASTALVLSPDVELRGEDWLRMGALMGIFILYLLVFVAFGLLASALTHRRMTAFLGLLALWTVWVFIVPNLAADAARRLIPALSFYDLQNQDTRMRWDLRNRRRAEMEDYDKRHNTANLDALPEAQRKKAEEDRREARFRIDTQMDAEYLSRLAALQTEWRGQMRQQQRLAAMLGTLSPVSGVGLVTMDLARTGQVQQERLERALNAYTLTLSQFVRDTQRQTSAFWHGADLGGFSWFTYKDQDPPEECLSRNVLHILNLALLAILGFAGAYVAILRYDVR